MCGKLDFVPIREHNEEKEMVVCYFFFFSAWRHKTNAVCAGNLKVSGVVSSNGR